MTTGTYRGEEKVCLGFDIGCTTSAVAFAHLKNGEEPHVRLVTRWPGQDEDVGDYKVPTVVSYDTQGCAIDFGTEAVENDGLQDTTLIKRFKLHLYPAALRAKGNLTPPPLPSDVSINQIYADFLKYLFGHARNHVIDSSIVDWDRLRNNLVVVMTIPGGWGDTQLTFLREAVVAAGILPVNHSHHRLQFVSEAEASIHFAIHYGSLDSGLDKGSTLAVCDAGGSTFDTTVYMCTSAAPKLHLRQVIASEGIQAGSDFVDDAARLFLERKLSGSVKYGTEDVIEYMVREFERNTKRQFDGTQDRSTIRFGEISDNDRLHGIAAGRLTLNRYEVKSMFRLQVTAIATSIDEIMERSGGFDSLLLVGGFGESSYLRVALGEHLQSRSVEQINISESTIKASAEGSIIWFANQCVDSQTTIKITPLSDTSSKLAEEIETARQREEALKLALVEVEQRIQAVKANGMAAQGSSEKVIAEATRQLLEEHHAARQYEEGLNFEIREAEKLLQATRKDGAEAKRLNDQLAADLANRLAEQRRATRQREEQISTNLSKTQARLEAYKANQTTNHLFGETDDSAITALFENFISAVKDLVSFITDRLTEDEQAEPVVINHLSGLTRTNEQIGETIQSFLALMTQLQVGVGRIAAPVVQYITFSLLADRIFLPTSLASNVPQEASKYLQALQERVAAHEPQEMYGRWRAITYTAIRANGDDNALAREIVTEISHNVSAVLEALLPSSAGQADKLAQRLFDGLKERATRLVLDAIKLQDTIQRVHVSHDYTVFFAQSDEPYSASDMEAFDLGPDATNALQMVVQQAARGTVLLPLVPGLRATRVTQNLSRSDVAVKKASVITLI